MTIAQAISDQNVKAVILFFVVSGFCISAATQNTNFFSAADLAAYALRRMSRILPLYWLAILFTVAVGIWTGDITAKSYSVPNLVGNLAFLQSSASLTGFWFSPYGGNGPFWSLSYEVFYYGIFPAATLLELSFLNRYKHAEAVALAVSYLVSVAALALFQWAPNPILNFLSLYCVWRVGVCLHRVLRGGGRGPFAALAAGAAGVLVPQLRSSATASMILAGSLIGIGWLVTQSLVRRVVDWSGGHEKHYGASVVRPLAAVGSVSYAIYLFHYPALKAGRAVFGDTIAGLVVSIVFAFAIAVPAEAVGRSIRERINLRLRPVLA